MKTIAMFEKEENVTIVFNVDIILYKACVIIVSSRRVRVKFSIFFKKKLAPRKTLFPWSENADLSYV